jgi:hypothetical protein
MSKLLKAAATIIVIGGIAAGVGYWVSPQMSVDSNDSQQIYGSTITFRVTAQNFSPFPKEVRFASEDTGVTILVDGAQPQAAVTKENTQATVTLAPFSSQTFSRAVLLNPSALDAKTPQSLTTDIDKVNLSAGQHTVRATWGGNTSWDYTFGVR